MTASTRGVPDPISCEQCGRSHVRCAGHIKVGPKKGEPCGQPRMRGQRVCRKHGGKAPQNMAAGERRREQEAAEKAVAMYGLPIDISPAEALLEEIRWTAGHVAWLRIRVQEIEESDLVWGVTQEVHKGSGEHPGTDTTKAAAPNVWLDLYDRERKHLVGVCAAALKAGVDERRVRLAEQQGARIADVLRRALDAVFEALVRLGMASRLVEEWPRLVAEIAPRELRAAMDGEGEP